MGSSEWLEASEGDDNRLAELIGEPAGLLAEEDVAAIKGAKGRLIDWARVPAAAIEELENLIDEDEAEPARRATRVGRAVR